MGRTCKWLVFAAGVLALTAIGPFDTAAQDAKAPPKAAAKAAPQPAAPVFVGNDAAVKQWEQRFAPQVRQAHRMELHFMRLVTEPTKQQYEKIAADTEPVMKTVTRKLAEAIFGGRGNQSDPSALIAEAVAKSVEATLSPEQTARYQKEIDLRAVARKRLIVLNLVAMTDKLLVLRPDQREKLGEILADNWNESWNQTQIYMYGYQYFPPMPEAKITPILSDAQRTVWRGIQKTTVNFGFNWGFMQVGDVEDEVWDEDQSRKAPEQADKDAPPKNPGPPKAADKP